MRKQTGPPHEVLGLGGTAVGCLGMGLLWEPSRRGELLACFVCNLFIRACFSALRVGGLSLVVKVIGQGTLVAEQGNKSGRSVPRGSVEIGSCDSGKARRGQRRFRKASCVWEGDMSAGSQRCSRQRPEQQHRDPGNHGGCGRDSKWGLGTLPNNMWGN